MLQFSLPIATLLAPGALVRAQDTTGQVTKQDIWVAPPKDGQLAEDFSRLSLEERFARVAAHRRGHLLLTESDDAAGASTEAEEAHLANSVPSRVDLAKHHQLDRGPDGDLWAFGGTYKARFGADGASYAPFFGSDAPQNYPVTFQLERVTLGGEPLPVDLSVTPEFVGNSAVYDRADLTERYDTRVGAMEQVFVLDTLPGVGDLVVRMHVESELAGGTDGNGLIFSNELGSVLYSNAVAIDGRGRRAAVPTVLEGDDIVLTVPAWFVADAVLPLTIDPVIATFVVEGAPLLNCVEADIAYDLTEDVFLITWDRIFSAADIDVFAQTITQTGALIPGGGAFIEGSFESWSHSACANNRAASQFLVVAARTVGGFTEVWGRTRAAGSNLMGVQFEISSGTPVGDSVNPDVGGNPDSVTSSHYCVVWEHEETIGVDHDIYARLVLPSSVLVGPGPISVDASSGSLDTIPAISKSCGIAPASTQVWNIAWERAFTATDHDIHGAQIGPNGAIVTSSFTVESSPRDALRPDPSSPLDPVDGVRRYMIVYSADQLGNRDVFASAIRGTSVFTTRSLSTMWGPPLEGRAESNCAVDTDGHQFTVVVNYHTSGPNWDVAVASFYLSESTLVLTEDTVDLNTSPDFEGYPEICALHSGGAVSDLFGVAWEDFGTQGDIEAGMYRAPGGYGLLGDAYCTSAPNSLGLHGVLQARGAGLVSLQNVTLEASSLPLNATLFFITSLTPGFVTNAGGSSGNLCLGGNIGRYVAPGQIKNTGSVGRASLRLNLNQHPTPTGSTMVMPGQTWRFQAWHRDVVNGITTSNFTHGLEVAFF